MLADLRPEPSMLEVGGFVEASSHRQTGAKSMDKMIRDSFWMVALLLFLTGCQEATPSLATDTRLDRWAELYAPDKRTDRVVLHRSGDTLSGYTTQPILRDSIAQWQKTMPNLIDQVRFLPDTAVGTKTVGLIKVAVANLRTRPGHSQELATQALLGTPVQLLDRQQDWFLVRTPDRYLAWLEAGAFVSVSPKEANDWFARDLRQYATTFGDIRSAPGSGKIVATVGAGGWLALASPPATVGAYTRVTLPDGLTGWLPAADLRAVPGISQDPTFSAATLLAFAHALAGRPYLWGGTSATGMDCSGFTKMAWYLQGFVIPRDASQQVRVGAEVPIEPTLTQLLPGDLLFFGNYREDGSQRITHTGFYLGEGQFLHAGADNGRITTNGLRAEDDNYAPHRRKTLLQARRLRPGMDGVVPVQLAFGALMQPDTAQ